MSKRIILYETKANFPDDPNELTYRRSYLGTFGSEERLLFWDRQSHLNGLLEPMGSEKFFQKVFGNTFAHFASKNTGRFKKYFSIDELGKLLMNRNVPVSQLRLYDRASNTVNADILLSEIQSTGRKTLDPEKIQRFLFNDYGSLAIESLQSVHPRVASLGDDFNAWIKQPVNINSYFTLKGGKTLKWHWDPYDVFVLQVEGSKQWDIYEPNFSFPLEDDRFFYWLDVGLMNSKKIASFTLNEGDVLYVPMGFPHNVTAVKDKNSLHITVGVHSYRWFDLLTNHVMECLRDFRKYAKLRAPARNITAGHYSQTDDKLFKKLAADFSKYMNGPSSRKVMERVLASSPALHSSNHAIAMWKTLGSPAQPTQNSLLKRTKTPIQINPYADFIRVRVGNEVILYDKCVRRALQFVQRHDSFILSDIPGKLTLKQRQELVRPLIQNGAVKFA